MSTDFLTDFPPAQVLQTDAVLRALIQAHRNLAELKGVAQTLPNENLLISTLSLQEAQSSSEIENIVTTQDALYKYRIQPRKTDLASREVEHYAKGLGIGFKAVRESGLLTLNTILKVQRVLEGNDAGFRKTPDTVLRNEQTGEVVYKPPSPQRVPELMSALEQFIHGEHELDALVCMALIHHQFESIHPFYDGNGRTGRIINILYLIKEGLLDTPILYLSRYINQTRPSYYQYLQQARQPDGWEQWLLYMIQGVAVTARHTIQTVERIRELLQRHKQDIRSNYPFYSQALINNIFRHPYTKVVFLARDMDVSRATATRYLDALAQGDVLTKHRLGRENYYVNHALVEILF